MIDVSVWMQTFFKTLNNAFADRVWFVGVQGSYGRGEATENSDIDLVVILDQLLPSDIEKYNSVLDTLSHRELMCGFLSGKSELFNWDTADLFQFYHDTKPIYGSLDALLPLIDDKAVYRAVKTGACNIYHGCVHNMLYEKNAELLANLYKSSVFVMQATVFLQSGEYISKHNALAQAVSKESRYIVDTFFEFKNGKAVEFEKASIALFNWAKSIINNVAS